MIVLHRRSPPSPTLPHARDLHGRCRTQASLTSMLTHIDTDAAARRHPPPPQPPLSHAGVLHLHSAAATRRGHPPPLHRTQDSSTAAAVGTSDYSRTLIHHYFASNSLLSSSIPDHIVSINKHHHWLLNLRQKTFTGSSSSGTCFLPGKPT
jgi:hypothetical protein